MTNKQIMNFLGLSRWTVSCIRMKREIKDKENKKMKLYTTTDFNYGSRNHYRKEHNNYVWTIITYGSRQYPYHTYLGIYY